jgi:hypothetical protein
LFSTTLRPGLLRLAFSAVVFLAGSPLLVLIKTVGDLLVGPGALQVETRVDCACL